MASRREVSRGVCDLLHDEVLEDVPHQMWVFTIPRMLRVYFLHMPLLQAAAILLPILCVMDLFAIRAYRGEYSTPNLWILMPSGAVGVALGALAFGGLDERWLRVIVGAVAVALHHAFGVALLRGRVPEARPPRVLSGSFWGVAGGFTSALAHAGATPGRQVRRRYLR